MQPRVAARTPNGATSARPAHEQVTCNGMNESNEETVLSVRSGRQRVRPIPREPDRRGGRRPVHRPIPGGLATPMNERSIRATQEVVLDYSRDATGLTTKLRPDNPSSTSVNRAQRYPILKRCVGSAQDQERRDKRHLTGLDGKSLAGRPGRSMVVPTQDDELPVCQPPAGERP